MSGDARASGLGRREVALVFVLALLPRLAHFLFVRATPLAGQYVPDLSAYLYTAQQIVDVTFFFHQPMVMSPGYPLLLAPMLALIGPETALLVLENALFDAGSAALVAGLAARLAPEGLQRRAGLMAGLLYAFCGQMVFYALLPLAEGPAMFCLLAALTLLFRATDAAEGGARGNNLSLYLAGALFALAALLRPNLAPAAPLAALALCLPRTVTPRKQRLHSAGRFLVGMLLALSPFMGHNLILEGRPTPFGFQGGITFYTGNFPGASGLGDSVGFTDTPYLVVLQSWAEAAHRLGRPLTLSEADAYWYGQGLRFFAQHPGQAALLLGKKALLLLNAHGRDATADLDFSRRFSPVPGWLPLPLGVCFALAAVGLLRVPQRRPRPQEGLALAAVLGWTALSVVLFQVTPRYRCVLLPFVLCFAALALAELPALLRLPPRRALAPALLLVVILGLAHIPLGILAPAGDRLLQEHLRLARYALMTGDQPQAQASIDAALALGAARDPQLAEQLRRMRRASVALQGRAAP